jgi:hypothetical protein
MNEIEKKKKKEWVSAHIQNKRMTKRKNETRTGQTCKKGLKNMQRIGKEHLVKPKLSYHQIWGISDDNLRNIT